METKRIFRKKSIFVTMAFFVIFMVIYIKAINIMPQSITMLEGDEYIYEIKVPFPLKIKADKDGIIRLNDDGSLRSTGVVLNNSKPMAIKTEKGGTVQLDIRMLWLLPLRTVKVDVIPNRMLAVCGNTVGVKLKADGIMVLGVAEVDGIDGKKKYPVKSQVIKPGDLILEVGEKNIEDIDDLIDEIQKNKGEIINIKLKRGNKFFETNVKPEISLDDKKYHIGLWVRDSVAGIGTMTFYDPQTKCFGALGHGITDADTGGLIQSHSGEVLEANVIAVKRGQVGKPGELKGVFVEYESKLGTIGENCEQGIYGFINNRGEYLLNKMLYPIALKKQISEGPAKILASIEGESVLEYDIEIQKVLRQNASGSKGMVIKIIDKKLIDKTGGIIQGMSGSPIIQNGKIIGAVTHVLVNNPTMGYGIFIEDMLKNIKYKSSQEFEKAR